MANAKGKSIDTSRLSNEDGIKYMRLHRDYLAHVLRYDYVYKLLKQNSVYKHAKVLDVGCGGNTPLAKLMFHNMMKHEANGVYVGVDYGTIGNPVHPGEGNTSFNARLYQKTDFLTWVPDHDEYDFVVCFEVLEHVEPEHAFQLIRKMRNLTEKRGGRMLVSTPIYSERLGAAGSHVNEMSYDGLKWLFDINGLYVEKVFGTFASQVDYKKTLNATDAVLFERLNKYYDANVVACIMAPLISPKACRNAIWELSVNPHGPLYLNPVPGSSHHSSSKLWTPFVESYVNKTGIQAQYI